MSSIIIAVNLNRNSYIYVAIDKNIAIQCARIIPKELGLSMPGSITNEREGRAGEVLDIVR